MAPSTLKVRPAGFVWTVTWTVAVGVGVAVGGGVGVGDGCGQKKISIEAVGVVGAYPPASQILVVPFVSVGKLRRAVMNAGTGSPVVQVLVPGS